MPVLRYWDVASGAYIVVPGSPGPAGPAGPGLAAGGAVSALLSKHSATDYDTQWSPVLNVNGPASVGSLPAGAVPKFYMGTVVVTTTSFSTADIAIPASMFSGYSAVAMVGDATPSNNLGVTVLLSQCTLTLLRLTVWNNNNGGIASTGVRINFFAFGA